MAGPMAQDDAPVRLRAALAGIPSYSPGRRPAPRAGAATYKLSSNENPYSPLPSVLAAVARSAQTMNRYPDPGCAALTAAIAGHLDVPVDSVVTAAGSIGALGQVVTATCGPGDEFVYPWRSFEAYPILVRLAGARGVPVPLTPDARHDLPAMADAVTARTRLVLVCSPNNPTGPVAHADELEALLDHVPADVTVVIDEAYAEFVRDSQAPDAIALQRARPNVVVLRTFSKAHGLAGLRVGYAVAHPLVATALRKTAVPFGVSTIAQDAALASLAASAELAERVDALVAERDRVTAQLLGQGWRLPDTQANFVWFPVGDLTPDLAADFAAAGLSVRPYAVDGVRATIGEPAANDALIGVAGAFRSRGSG